MSADTQQSNPEDDIVLYEKRKKVFPQSIKGFYRNIRWGIMIVTLGIYYFTPFIRWDRGPNAPDQAVLIDFPGRRFYFFMIEIWPQEVYYFTGLLILASMALFLMNALAGRVWCGYLCPQTVWTDLFYAVERLVEGDRRDQLKLEKSGWTAKKVGEKTLKHGLWLMIAWWTGGAWVLYFADAPTLVRDLATGQAPLVAYLWIAILTFTTYTLAGHMREQVCIYMCPWPRIQAALTDEWALNVTYRYDRGEPRNSLKAAEKRIAKGEPAGDCIDCRQCVAVCPTGVDIRDGLQLGCIQCALCIDACDAVMDKVGKERGLIAWDTDINTERRQEGKEPLYRPIRPRTLIYVGIIGLVSAIMLFTLVTRSFTHLSVLHDRNPLYVELSDGGLRNGYTIRLINKRPYDRTFILSAEGLPGLRVEAVGIQSKVGGWPAIKVDPDTTREVRVLLFSPTSDLPRSSDIRFRITDIQQAESATAKDFFKAP